MLVDANLLLYATDDISPDHRAASGWLTSALNGDRRVGIAWQTIGAFLRISTHPRVTRNPLTGARAWAIARNWLAADPVWIPPATDRTARAYGTLTDQVSITANLVPDAQLAALAIEHGLTLYSADSDFVRFPGLTWVNPLRPSVSGGR
jgi:toxin-antitoxin system PIN domain toxin